MKEKLFASSHCRSKFFVSFKRVLYAFLTVLFLMSFTVHAANLGDWYYDDFGIEALHAEGIDGSGIKIADIDTMINTSVTWLADADIVVREKNITEFYGDISPVTDDFNLAYHATDMVSLLVGNGEGATNGNAPLGLIPGATVYHYSAVHSEDDSVTGGDIYDEAMKLAVEDEVDLIIIPAGGLSYFDEQYPYFLEAIKKGIPVMVAHANERIFVAEETHPESYNDENGEALPFDSLLTSDIDGEISYWPGLVTVQCLNTDGSLQILSNTEDPGTDIASPGEGIWMEFYSWGNFEPSGGGCSAATTVTGGYLALAMQKWPDATGNQILQLMVRCTDLQSESALTDAGMDVIENLTRDNLQGFGVIDMDKMMSTDPTLFPDVNPILYLDISRYVKNASARGSEDELKENEALLEIAQVLDDQLSPLGLERPDFLVTLLGERDSVDAQEASLDASASNTEGSGDETATRQTDASTTNAGVNNASSGGSDMITFSLSVSTLLLIIGAVLALIVILVIVLNIKNKR